MHVAKDAHAEVTLREKTAEHVEEAYRTLDGTHGYMTRLQDLAQLGAGSLPSTSQPGEKARVTGRFLPEAINIEESLAKEATQVLCARFNGKLLSAVRNNMRPAINRFFKVTLKCDPFRPSPLFIFSKLLQGRFHALGLVSCYTSLQR